MSGWGVRRALREGEGMRWTEKHEAGAGRAGPLVRRSQMTGGSDLTNDAGELETAEVD
jgi:hypothetical protein